MEFLNSIFSIETGTATNIGYLILFLIALLEATPVGGILVPGQTIVIIAGVMAKFGIFHFWIVVALAAVGAIAGDYAGYIIGKKYGYGFLSKYGKYFFFKKEQLEKTKKLMHAHCGKTLIIGRFNSFTRAFAPLIAGTSDIKLPKFATYGIISGISWAIFYAGLGYIFGQSYEIASKYIGRISMIGLGLIILGVGLYYLINKKRHIYERFHMKILAINILSFYSFFKVMDDVVNGDWLTKIDDLSVKFIDSISTPLLTKIMDVTVILTSAYVFAAIVLASIFILIWKRNHMQAGVFTASIGFTALGVYVLKELIERPRPFEALIEISGFSFPSSHAALSAAFFLLIIYAFRRRFKNWALRTLFIFINLFLIALIGFSRLYFHVHYFTDVLAGFAFGISSVTFFLLAFKFALSQIESWKKYRKNADITG